MQTYRDYDYHATLAESAASLWRCLVYSELNMVRCGVVGHPRQWPWVGSHESMGTRSRYRLRNPERLCWRVATASLEELGMNLNESLAQAIAQDRVKWEAFWTQSLVVGANAFVKKIRPSIRSRRETEIVETDSSLWILKETSTPYGQKTGPKNAAKDLTRTHSMPI